MTDNTVGVVTGLLYVCLTDLGSKVECNTSSQAGKGELRQERPICEGSQSELVPKRRIVVRVPWLANSMRSQPETGSSSLTP